MNIWIVRSIAAVGCCAALLAACGDQGTAPGRQPITQSFSFETGLGAWSAKATDVLVAGEPVDWQVSLTQQASTDGSHAASFSLDNRSDAGKIWIERSFDLEPRTYQVQLSFDLGTSDFGDVNLWTIIAGVFASAPETGQDLESAFQGDTGHEQGSGAGLVWLRKSYDFSATPGSDGMLHVAIGVWGTYEVQRAYLVDAVAIVFTPTGPVLST